MQIKMIDAQIANEVMSSISIDDIVTGLSADWRYSLPVVSKTSYSLTLQSPLNKVIVSVSTLDKYKELEMARIPMPTAQLGSAPRRGVGRPPKATGPQAPAEFQQNAPPAAQDDAPVGGWEAPTGSAGGQAWGAQPQADAPSWQPPAQTQEIREPTAQEKIASVEKLTGTKINIDYVEGDKEWFRNAIESIKENLAADLEDIAVALEAAETQNDAVEPENIIAHVKTCWDCKHVSYTENQCGYYKMVPPMKIIANAEKECATFEADEIPY